MKNPFFAGASSARNLFAITILFLTHFKVFGQNYWDKVPQLTSQCYSDKDAFGSQVEKLRTELQGKIESSKQRAEEKVGKMSDKEKMALATRYQNMTPDEIMKMQNEMSEMTQMMTTFQQLSSEYEEQFNKIESDYQAEFATRLGAIEREYQKLPDGEGMPDWAVKKAKELTIQYNQEYENLCSKYFTTTNSIFQKWLREYNNFLIDKEVPFTEKQIKIQYQQYGIEPEEGVANLMAVDKYLEKCAYIYGLRKSYPQG